MDKIRLFTIFLVLFSADLSTSQILTTTEKNLPRYERGKIRRSERTAALRPPYMLSVGSDPLAPGTAQITTLPEHESCDGVILRWGEWNQLLITLIREAADSNNGSLVYLLVSNDLQAKKAAAVLNKAGVDMNQVKFIKGGSNSIWIRDYGPFFILLNGLRALVDTRYYLKRPLDNAVPFLLHENWYWPFYDLPLKFPGGNLWTTSDMHGYMSDLIYYHNPSLSSSVLASLCRDYLGLQALHIFPAFPNAIDRTGHIDMWMNIISEDKVIIGEYRSDLVEYEAYAITEYAAVYMHDLGFEVLRVPGKNDGEAGYNGTHYTYTNSLILNHKVFVPQYGGEHKSGDVAALAVYQAALPDKTIIGIDCSEIIKLAGAIHCIAKPVPRFPGSKPKVKVLSPDGDEVWAAGYPREIRWAADDDQKITAVDIHYSWDGGSTYPYVIALNEPHDGLYKEWLIPYHNSWGGRIKITAYDDRSNSAFDLSDNAFATEIMDVAIYDFSRGAGEDKWIFGFATDSWEQDLENTRLPVGCAVEVNRLRSNAYNSLSYSDADAGSAFVNHYKNPQPAPSDESTLIVVFTLKDRPGFVRSIEFMWEGYAHLCQPIEIYVWDYSKGNWSNGKGAFGRYNFLAHGSHNHDRVLKGAIKDDVWRYVSDDREVTFLIYCGFSEVPTFHDYMSLTVQSSSYLRINN